MCCSMADRICMASSASVALFAVLCVMGVARGGASVHLAGWVVVAGSLRRHRGVHERIVHLSRVGGKRGGERSGAARAP